MVLILGLQTTGCVACGIIDEELTRCQVMDIVLLIVSANLLLLSLGKMLVQASGYRRTKLCGLLHALP
jgi:hypothetical protein